MFLDKNNTEIYKGIAILCVILSHTMGVFGQGITIFTPLGGIGVAVFLFLSAYGLNESWKSNIDGVQSYQGWWRKRFISVWIPYMIIQLIAYWPFHQFHILPFALDLMLIKPLHPNGWYLQYLFLWYVIFYVVRRIKPLDKSRILIFAVMAFILFFTQREIKAEQSMSFFSGIMISERKDWQEKLFKIRQGGELLIFGVLALAVKQTPFIRSSTQLIMNIVQLCIKLPIGLGLIIIYYFVMERWKFIKWIGLAGSISYELYLIHGYVLSIVPVTIYGMIIFIFRSVVLSVGYGWIMRFIKPKLMKVLGVKNVLYLKKAYR